MVSTAVSKSTHVIPLLGGRTPPTGPSTSFEIKEKEGDISPGSLSIWTASLVLELSTRLVLAGPQNRRGTVRPPQAGELLARRGRAGGAPSHTCEDDGAERGPRAQREGNVQATRGGKG